MGRSTVYNKITTPELLEQILEKNKELIDDYIDYCWSSDRSPATIKQYHSALNIFFVWNLTHNKNKFFKDIKKKELSSFQGFAMNRWGWSPKRIRFVKSVISSLSNYIVDILDEDEDYEDYVPIVNKIPNPDNVAVREKTVIPDELVDYLLKTLVDEERFEEACIVSLSANSGMRKSELLQMKLEWFDESLVEDFGMWKSPKIRTKGSGKLGKRMEKYTLYNFKPYLDLWVERRKELGIDSEWMFVVKDHESEGNVWKKRKEISHWTKRFTKIIGTPFYFHAMRHYTCTLLSRKNLPTSVIVKFFGWSDESMIKIYNDMSAEDEFDKYFSKDGIKEVEKGSLSDL